MYELGFTEHFRRRLPVFLRKHPELVQRVERVLDDLKSDPAAPRLRLHALRGRHQGKYAVTVTRPYRITLTINVRERYIELLDIGSHDELYS